MTLTPQQIKRLLQTAAFAGDAEETELFCDSVQSWLAAYAETALGGGDAAASYPAVARHLRFCSDCREQYAALLAILADASPPPEIDPDWSRIPPPASGSPANGSSASGSPANGPPAAQPDPGERLRKLLEGDRS